MNYLKYFDDEFVKDVSVHEDHITINNIYNLHIISVYEDHIIVDDSIYINSVDISLDLSMKCHESICDYLVFILDIYYKFMSNMKTNNFMEYMEKINFGSTISNHISRMDGYGCTKSYKNYYRKHKPKWKI